MTVKASLACPPVLGGGGQAAGQVSQLQERAGPAVGQHDRQGVGILAVEPQKVHSRPVDGGHVRGQGVKGCFLHAPVEVRAPDLHEPVQLGASVPASQPVAGHGIGQRVPLSLARRSCRSASGTSNTNRCWVMTLSADHRLGSILWPASPGTGRADPDDAGLSQRPPVGVMGSVMAAVSPR
jgi:hypothetical protein